MRAILFTGRRAVNAAQSNISMRRVQVSCRGANAGTSAVRATCIRCCGPRVGSIVVLRSTVHRPAKCSIGKRGIRPSVRRIATPRGFRRSAGVTTVPSTSGTSRVGIGWMSASCMRGNCGLSVRPSMQVTKSSKIGSSNPEQERESMLHQIARAMSVAQARSGQSHDERVAESRRAAMCREEK